MAGRPCFPRSPAPCTVPVLRSAAADSREPVEGGASPLRPKGGPDDEVRHSHREGTHARGRARRRPEKVRRTSDVAGERAGARAGLAARGFRARRVRERRTAHGTPPTPPRNHWTQASCLRAFDRSATGVDLQQVARPAQSDRLSTRARGVDQFPRRSTLQFDPGAAGIRCSGCLLANAGLPGPAPRAQQRPQRRPAQLAHHLVGILHGCLEASTPYDDHTVLPSSQNAGA